MVLQRTPCETNFKGLGSRKVTRLELRQAIQLSSRSMSDIVAEILPFCRTRMPVQNAGVPEVPAITRIPKEVKDYRRFRTLKLREQSRLGKDIAAALGVTKGAVSQ